MKKKILVGIGVMLTLGVSGLVIVFLATSAQASAADSFLGLLGERKIHDAYLQTASGFQGATSEPEFRSMVKKLNPTHVAATSWPHRSLVAGRSELRGSVTFQDGRTLPLQLVMVREMGQWRIHSIQLLSGGLRTN